MTSPADEPSTTPGEGVATTNAYELLSKPTLEITNAELAIIVADLQRKRAAYVSDKKIDDKPGKPAPAASKKTAAEKAEAAADLLASIGLG